MKTSKKVEQFLNICDECRKQYDINYEIVGNCDKKTTDYLHSLELEALSYSERAKLTTAEKQNLRERREAKNIIEQGEPLREWLKTNEAIKAINLLRQVLGAMRRVEVYHENRSYKKRL